MLEMTDASTSFGEFGMSEGSGLIRVMLRWSTANVVCWLSGRTSYRGELWRPVFCLIMTQRAGFPFTVTLTIVSGDKTSCDAATGTMDFGWDCLSATEIDGSDALWFRSSDLLPCGRSSPLVSRNLGLCCGTNIASAVSASLTGMSGIAKSGD